MKKESNSKKYIIILLCYYRRALTMKKFILTNVNLTNNKTYALIKLTPNFDVNNNNSKKNSKENSKKKGNYSKFIATAVEAMVAAIYIEEKENINILLPLFEHWMTLCKI